jgi:hypothetical protein
VIKLNTAATVYAYVCVYCVYLESWYTQEVNKMGSSHVKQAMVICMLKFLRLHRITKTLLQIFVKHILPNFCRTVRVVGVFVSLQTNPNQTSDSCK